MELKADFDGLRVAVAMLLDKLYTANAALATSLDLAARSIHVADHKGSFDNCKIGFCHQRAEITESYRLKGKDDE